MDGITDINTELFIDEIRKKTALWDITSESYKERDLKKRNWIELANVFFPDFDNQTPKQKSAMINDLQKKWKNIKDSYRKHLKSKKTKSGQERTKERNYIFAPYLTFLDGSLRLGPTEDSPNVPIGNVGEEDVDFNVEVPLYSRATSSRIALKRKNNLESKLESYIEAYQENMKRTRHEEEGDDMSYFRSLLPIVKNLPLHDKFMFRMDTMKIAMQYANKNNTQSVNTTPAVTDVFPPMKNSICPSSDSLPQSSLYQSNDIMDQPQQRTSEFVAASNGVHGRLSSVRNQQSVLNSTSEVLRSIRSEIEESNSRDSFTKYSVESGGSFFNESDF